MPNVHPIHLLRSNSKNIPKKYLDTHKVDEREGTIGGCKGGGCGEEGGGEGGGGDGGGWEGLLPRRLAAAALALHSTLKFAIMLTKCLGHC